MIDSRYHKLANEMATAWIDDIKAHHRDRDIAAIQDEKRASIWFYAAGVDWEAAISRLRKDGHLTPTPGPLKPKPVPLAVSGSREMADRVYAKLSAAESNARTVRQIADTVGSYGSIVRRALTLLETEGRAHCRAVVRHGGPVILWWREKSSEKSHEIP